MPKTKSWLLVNNQPFFIIQAHLLYAVINHIMHLE